MKVCILCKIEKELSEFNKNCSKKDGLNTLCRKCSNAKSKEYYKNNGEKHRSAVNARRKKAIKEMI
jgi:5-methylcytosine-specific restriction endonuclease McrA